MKILIFFLLFSSNLLQAEITGYCKEPIDSNYINSYFSLEMLGKEKIEIFINVAKILNNIIELKFKSSQFIESNKELFGEFTSLSEKMKNYKNLQDLIKEDRNKLKYTHQIQLSIIMKQENFFERFRLISIEKKDFEKEMQILQIKEFEINKKLEVTSDSYYKALAKWQPYKDYLVFYDNLEKSLLKSLSQIQKILDSEIKTSTFDLLLDFKNKALQSELTTKDWLNLNDQEREKYCYQLNLYWINFLKSTSAMLE